MSNNELKTKLQTLDKRYKIDAKKVCYILGWTKKKLSDFNNGVKVPSEYDIAMITRLMKVYDTMSKHYPTVEEIDHQKELIENLKSRLNRYGICADNLIKMKDNVDDIIREAMYLGAIMANRNQDEIILKEIRKRRI